MSDIASERRGELREVALYVTLHLARKERSGFRRSGYLTATPLCKRAGVRRGDGMAILIGSGLFRELDEDEARRLGAKSTARLFGLAEWVFGDEAASAQAAGFAPEIVRAYNAARARLQ